MPDRLASGASLPSPTSSIPEVRRLVQSLDALRAGVLKKVHGLSDHDATRSTVASGTTLAGIVQHLTFVESFWFEEIGAGRKAKETRSMEKIFVT